METPDFGEGQIPVLTREWEHLLLEKIAAFHVRAVSLGVSGPGGFWRLQAQPRADAGTAESLFRLTRSFLTSSAGENMVKDDSSEAIPGQRLLMGRAFEWAGRKAALCVLTRDSGASPAELAPYLEKAIGEIAAEGPPSGLDEGQDKLSMVGRLAEVALQYGCFAHEVNGPLANLRATLELQLLEAENTKHLPERLQKAVNQVNRIESLVASLRRSIGGESLPDPTPERIADIMEECAAIAGARAIREKVRVTVEVPQNFILPCRRGEITQAILNLLNNSLDAVADQPEKTVSITARQNRGVASILIQDSGPGISPQVERNLMQPYVTTKGEKGTGLGLFLSRRLVESHSGALLPVLQEKRPAFAIFLPA